MGAIRKALKRSRNKIERTFKLWMDVIVVIYETRLALVTRATEMAAVGFVVGRMCLL